MFKQLATLGAAILVVGILAMTEITADPDDLRRSAWHHGLTPEDELALRVTLAQVDAACDRFWAEDAPELLRLVRDEPAWPSLPLPS